jgi:anti-anti-sigma factor
MYCSKIYSKNSFFMKGNLNKMKLVNKDTQDGFMHIALAGRLDMDGVEAIELEFTATIGKAESGVIVDLENVDFLASLGMRMLLSSAKLLNSKGVSIVLLNPQILVLETLQIAGFDSLFQIEDSLENAIKTLQK